MSMVLEEYYLLSFRLRLISKRIQIIVMQCTLLIRSISRVLLYCL